MAYAVRKDVLALETDPKQKTIIIIGNNQWISHTVHSEWYTYRLTVQYMYDVLVLRTCVVVAR